MDEELRLMLLGGVRITRGGTPVTGFVSAKAQALLCYLAVTGRPHFRPALAGLLWGERPEANALMNLRQALTNLRRLFPSHIIVTRHTVAFNRNTPYWLDVEEFESGTRILESRFRIQDSGFKIPDSLIRDLEKTIKLYRGDFLEGFYVRDAPTFEEWMLVQRERLRALALQALHILTAYYTNRGKYPLALRYITQLLMLAPWQEEAHRQKMLLLARSGQHSAALAQYEICCRILAKELGVEPSAETQALYRRIKAARSIRRNNLPPQPTPFVGREKELAEIARLLANPDCRLLTLIGPGGIGKTRLAIQAAAQNSQHFLHGVWFVPLTSVPSTAFLVPAIAEALGFSFHSR
ncbi:MAG: SARP family transcriptional regulator, partial [Chloroflexi bacterium]